MPKKFDDVLRAVSLFKTISSDELSSMLDCLQARAVACRKGERILEAGNRPESVGIVLSGQFQIVRDDMDGNRTLLAVLAESDVFAEALCCAGVEESPVTVLAGTDAIAMLLQFSRILNVCPDSCEFHRKLIANMLRTLAQKNLYLQDRMELIRTKSVRARVLGYLSAFAAQHGREFSIPLNREEMADYLCVERSALSHELMRMKREGLIDYRKNKFVLYGPILSE